MKNLFKNLIVLFLIYLPLTSYSQYDDPEHPNFPPDSFFVESVGQLIPGEVDTFYGSVPEIYAKSPILTINNGYNIYFRFDNYSQHGANIVLRNTNLMADLNYTDLGNNSILFEGLDYDVTYKLIFTSTAVTNEITLDSIYISGEIPLGNELYETIEVSSELFDQYAIWLNDSNRAPIGEYFRDSSNLSNYELLSFYQLLNNRYDLIIEDIDFENTGILDLIEILGNNDPVISSECDCKFVVKIVNWAQVNPGTIVGATNGLGGHGIWGEAKYFHDPNPFGNGKSDFGYRTEFKGPSKYIQTKFEGVDLNKEYFLNLGWEVDNGSRIDGAAANYAKRSIIYSCEDRNDVPAECACNRDIVISYRYGTSLSAKAEVKSCLTCLNERNAEATVTDIAAVIIFDGANPNRYEIIDINSASARASNYSQVRDQTLINATSAAAGIAKIIISSQTTQALDLNQTIDDIEEVLINIINLGPLYLGSGNQSQNSTGLLYEPHLTRTLTVNKPFEVVLVSNSEHISKGNRNFKAQTTIQSAYRLGLLHKGGTKTGFEEYCCGPTFGSWSYATFEGAPFDYFDLNMETNDFLFLNGNWYSTPNVDIDFGILHGPKHQECSVESQGGAKQIKGELVEDLAGDVLVKENKLIYQYPETEVGQVTYEIYDFQGKLIKKGLTEKSTEILDLTQLQENCYIVKITHDNGSYSKKVGVFKR